MVIESKEAIISLDNPFKKNVLLLVHDVHQDFNTFPLAYGYLAAMLRKSGYSVEVYCMDVFHYTNDQLEKKLSNSEYDLIGAGFMPARFEETVIDLCKSVNQYKKKAWFFLGGPGPTPIPEYMLKRLGVDLVVLGEAEHTIVELMEAKLGQRTLADIKGIAYSVGDQVKINPRRPLFRELDQLPWPAWDLFPMESYTGSIQMMGMEAKEKMMTITASRGCTDTCSFCYRIEAGLRLRDLNEVIKEIKYLIETYGTTFFQFQDELFVFPRSRVFEFEKLIQENNLKISYCCNSRAVLFDEEVAQSLLRSGCKFVNIGFESVDQKVLDEMNKRVTVEENLRALEVANKVKIGVGLNFLWGFENDTAETLRKNVEAIKRYNSFDQVRTIRPPGPYPGSPLYYRAIEKGLLTGPDNFFQKFKNSDRLTVNFTRYSEEEYYKMLFGANKELVLHHFQNTTQDMEAAQELIDAFHRLYFEGDYKFRGSRKYDRESRKKASVSSGEKAIAEALAVEMDTAERDNIQAIELEKEPLLA